MSKIVVHELDSTVVRQQLTTLDKPIYIYALRPYVFRWLSPAGTAYMEIQDSNGKLIRVSESITIASIGTGNYWHGYYRFLVSIALRAETTYYFALKTSGYTYASNAYLGWCNDFDKRNAFGSSYDGANGMTAPLGLQIWGYKALNKGGI